MQTQRILMTGAAGAMGRKLIAHFTGRHELILLDQKSDLQSPNHTVHIADLSAYGDWAKHFADVDIVFHFAANPDAYHSWPELIPPNLDAMIHVYHAALQAKVKRFIFASSNHVMGGYQNDSGTTLSDQTVPRPGLRYTVNGKACHSLAYASAKLFGERLGRAYAESAGMETIAVRYGWIWRGGENTPANLPEERGEWFRLMWLSDRDFLQLSDCCVSAKLREKFVIVNGVSNNRGMKWDLEPGKKHLNFHPVDDVNHWTTPWPATSDI